MSSSERDVTRETTRAHTPGPWIAGSIRGTIYTDNAVFLARVESGNYTDWLNGNPFGNGVWEANVRLIAAAPDLFSALERARGCIRGLIRPDPVRDVGETLAEIDAALAKASGGSQTEAPAK